MSDATDKILIVDDEPSIGEVLSRWLKKEGYECRTAANVDEACKVLEEESFSLILLDLMMPEKPGEVLLHFVRERYPNIAVVMATAIDDQGTALDLLRKGAFGYVIKPLDQRNIVVNVASALQRREAKLVARDYQKCLEEEVRVQTAEIRYREEEIALRLAWASESHDKATGNHIRRIGLFAGVLAEALGWEPSKVNDIRIAAIMHDIGKIGMPDGILLKTDRLTPEEFEVVKKHTEIGASILNHSDIPLLHMAQEIALCHHEKWDGSGYPRGLVGEAIPESARIVAVVDVYDTVTQGRVYFPAFPEAEVLALMSKGRGQHFDPRILDCFIDLIPQIRQLSESIAQESQHSEGGEKGSHSELDEALFPAHSFTHSGSSA